MDASPELLFSQGRKPALDQVEPTGLTDQEMLVSYFDAVLAGAWSGNSPSANALGGYALGVPQHRGCSGLSSVAIAIRFDFR
jgi:hypothetical protein